MQGGQQGGQQQGGQQGQQHGQGDVQAVVLLEVGQAFMHRLLRNEKSLFTSGTFRVAKLENNRGEPVHFINFNSFYYGIQSNTYFIKMVYPDTIAYIFPHFQNGLSAISFPTNPQSMQPLDQLIAAVAKLYDLNTAMQVPEIRAMVEQHYPAIETQPIYYPDNLKKAIIGTGAFLNTAFTSIGGFFKTGVEKCGTYLDGKLSEGQPTELSASTKHKWQQLKQGTNNVIHVGGEYVTKIMTPVIAKTTEYSHNLENKINQSNNQTVKYAKDLAMVSGKAVGEAFDGLVKGGTDVTNELGAQGKKLINKKYGPDVINTMVGQPGEQKQEQMVEEKVEKKEEGAGPKDPPAGPAGTEQDSNVRLNDVSTENMYPDIEK